MANLPRIPKQPTEPSKSATPAESGRVFTISLKGVPRLDATTKARLEAAARAPGGSRPDYPQVIAD